MSKPEGKLTAAQHEILDVVWASEMGATVTEIWEVIGPRRKVTRTTILNLVDRLEKRGWLERQKTEGSFRYVAAFDRETTARIVAAEFVDDFFGGSASHLVMSLLGAKRLKPADAERLRQLLAKNTPGPPAKKVNK